MPDLRLLPGANEPNDVRLYPLEDTTQDVYLYPGAAEPNDVQLRPLGLSAPPLFSAGGATTYTISGNTAIIFAVACAPADTFVEPAGAGLAFTVASVEAAVFAEAGSTPLTFAVTAAFEYVPGLTVYTVTGSSAISFVAAAPVQFVSASPETPGGGGRRVRWRSEGVPWKPPALLFTHHGRAAIVLRPAATLAIAADVPAAIAWPVLESRSRRQFVNVPPPMEPLADDVAVLLAALL